MDLVHPEFVPDAGLTREEMEQLQHEISDAATFTDVFNFDPSLDGVVVAGIDQAFTDDHAVSGIVVMACKGSPQSGDGTPAHRPQVIERVHARMETKIPYIPGLLAFREGESILAAAAELSTEPDLLVIDGSGRIHFREAGIATHIGVLLDTPSIGVAKKLLCGTPKQAVDGLEQGERVPIMSDRRVETAARDTVIGYAYQSKQYPGERYVNPLYVSPGHRVDTETSVNLVQRLVNGYKLPEPTRLADRYVDQVKRGETDTGQETRSDR